MTAVPSCVFCAIVAPPPGVAPAPAALVLDEPAVVGFLDVRPVFPGHVLVVPREHHVTLADLPPALVTEVVLAARRVSVAVTTALGAQGSFVAMNNTVSQSVPHLHVHVVPRTKGDGLRGFFWPRQRYDSAERMADTAAALRAAVPPPQD